MPGPSVFSRVTLAPVWRVRGYCTVTHRVSLVRWGGFGRVCRGADSWASWALGSSPNDLLPASYDWYFLYPGMFRPERQLEAS